MALSAKKLKEVMKEKRRRDKLPPRAPSIELVSLSLKPRELSQITERCSEVLLAIEATIVQCARESHVIDDNTVKIALTGAIRQVSCDDEAAATISSRLAATRQSLSVTDEDWMMSLRAICTSVINNGKKNAGSLNYLMQARATLQAAKRSNSNPEL